MEDAGDVEKDGDSSDPNSDEAIEEVVRVDLEEAILSVEELPHKSAGFENAGL